MKAFQTLISETLEAQDLEELEAAADLFQFGVEKGQYTKRQADEFNTTFWKVKNKMLSYEVSENIKWNVLDIMSIVSSAPNDIKDSKHELINYVNGRLKALKGKVSGLK
jgi:vacuolar-type H+-ATPase subunit B/Vma2